VKEVKKMALKCDIELDSGLMIKDAYLRISSFSGTERDLSFQLNVYADKAYYNDNRPPVSYLAYKMNYDKDRNIFSQMYDYLGSLPEYEDAVEA